MSSDQGGSGEGASVDMVKLMQDIAASGGIEVPDQVEFNGTLYVRASEFERLTQGRDMIAEEREAWKQSATQLRAALEAAQGEITRLQLMAGDEYVLKYMSPGGLIDLSLREIKRLTRELEATRGVVEAGAAYQHAVKTLEAHEENCQDSPCEPCELYCGGVDEAEAALFQALDAAQAASNESDA